MNGVEIELLFALFLVLAIGAYIKGKKDNILFLISLGRRSSIILGILIIVYNLFIMREGL